jgi:hypothetical protein
MDRTTIAGNGRSSTLIGSRHTEYFRWHAACRAPRVGTVKTRVHAPAVLHGTRSGAFLSGCRTHKIHKIIPINPYITMPLCEEAIFPWFLRVFWRVCSAGQVCGIS